MIINKYLSKSLLTMMLTMPVLAFGQAVDSIPDVEISEVKILSSRVPLTRAQTPVLVKVISRDEILAAIYIGRADT